MGILCCIVTWLPVSAFGKQSLLAYTTEMMMQSTLNTKMEQLNAAA